MTLNKILFKLSFVIAIFGSIFFFTDSSNYANGENYINIPSDSIHIHYYPDGRIESICEMKNGRKMGTYIRFGTYEEDWVELHYNYSNDTLDGEYIVYSSSGDVIGYGLYNKGTLAQSNDLINVDSVSIIDCIKTSFSRFSVFRDDTIPKNYFEKRLVKRYICKDTL